MYKVKKTCKTMYRVSRNEVPELERKLKELIKAINAEDCELRGHIFDKKRIKMMVDEVAVTFYKTDKAKALMNLDSLKLDLEECGINSKEIHTCPDSSNKYSKSKCEFRDKEGLMLFFDVAQLTSRPFKEKYLEYCSDPIAESERVDRMVTEITEAWWEASCRLAKLRIKTPRDRLRSRQ
ncbi:hypothetical protein RLOatenuis_7640 [Rickettsiales bacterium]|nr:hypothetical protein RLOatenuis_7640 [Rickettsiales bacterium]